MITINTIEQIRANAKALQAKKLYVDPFEVRLDPKTLRK